MAIIAFRLWVLSSICVCAFPAARGWRRGRAKEAEGEGEGESTDAESADLGRGGGIKLIVGTADVVIVAGTDSRRNTGRRGRVETWGAEVCFLELDDPAPLAKRAVMSCREGSAGRGAGLV